VKVSDGDGIYYTHGLCTLGHGSVINLCLTFNLENHLHLKLLTHRVESLNVRSLYVDVDVDNSPIC